jgi:hypothetical protein
MFADQNDTLTDLQPHIYRRTGTSFFNKGYFFYVVLLIGAFTSTHAAPALSLTSKQIMSECRKKYGKSVMSGYKNKKGKIICTLRISDKRAMKVCRKKYGKSVSTWQRDKNGKIICVTGGGGGGGGASGCSQKALDTLPHGKKVDLCRKCFGHLGPTTLRKKRGKWICSYSN